MGKWLYTINLSHLWHNELSVDNLNTMLLSIKRQIVKIKHPDVDEYFVDEILYGIADLLDQIKNGLELEYVVEYFDDIMEALYDFGDIRVGKDKLCWISK